jgi:hypothetical protein
MYFFRRGMENMHQMTKSNFAVQVDPKTGMEYVFKTTDISYHAVAILSIYLCRGE